jgi:hypothetical protein
MKIDCIRCGIKFNCIDDFKYHLQKKTRCKCKYINVSIDKYIIKPKYVNSLFLDKMKEIKNSKEKLIVYGCEYCGKCFNNRKYGYRHKSNHCKLREANQVLYNEPNSLATNNQNTLTNNQNNSLSTNNVNNNIKNKNSSNTFDNINTLNNDINTQNNVSNINSNNTIINNFIIKNYDDNDKNDDDILKSISTKTKEKILLSPNTAIQNLYKLIHIDNPNYRNIYIKNPKDGFGFVYNDGEWDIKTMKELLTEIIETNSDRLYDITLDKKINIKKTYLNQCNQLFNKIADNGDYTNELRNKLKLMTYQNGHIIKDNYELNTKKKLKLIAKNNTKQQFK